MDTKSPKTWLTATKYIFLQFVVHAHSNLCNAALLALKYKLHLIIIYQTKCALRLTVILFYVVSTWINPVGY